MGNLPQGDKEGIKGWFGHTVLKLYNSYTKRKEIFRPLKKKAVAMYNCGPTVYDFAHIGNLRSFLFADILRRYLEYRGYRVRQVMNITDVGHMTTDADAGEDKMSLAMRREKKGPLEIARFYEEKFFEDIDALGFRRAWKYPRATEHVPEMVRLVEKLLKRGHAYKVHEGVPPLTPPQRGGEIERLSPPFQGGDKGVVRGVGDTCSVYYDLSTFPNYGKLSGNRVEDLIPGARAEVVHEKRNPYDFALWIYNPKHFLKWPSPWGAGYPGWHLECSAMAMKYLGATIDIHTGGEDNKFPHHECEIAQSEGATGKKFARFWLHAKHLLVDGKKMSKSLGNFYTLRDLVDRARPDLRRAGGPASVYRSIRYALISAHYRDTLNFTLESIEAAKAALGRVDELVEKLTDRHNKSLALSRSTKLSFDLSRARRDFIAAMDDDLNVPKALGVVFNFVRKLNRILEIGNWKLGIFERKDIFKLLQEFDAVLGLGIDFKKKSADIPAAVIRMVAERERAREAKDWKRADELREELKKRGFFVEDTPGGPRLKRVA